MDRDEIKRILSKRVVEARDDVPQAEIARRMGVKPPSLWEIEHGESCPSLPNAVSLARALDVSLDYLVGLADSPGRASTDEIDVGRWVLALPESLRQALLFSAQDRPDAPPPPAALTSPRPSPPAAQPAPPAPSASDPAEDEDLDDAALEEPPARRRSGTRTRRGS